MKKTVKVLLIGFTIALVLAIINIAIGYFTGTVIGISIPGGECIEYLGLEIYQLKLFALSSINESVSSQLYLRFEPISFLFTSLFCVLFVYLFENVKRKQ